MGFYTATVADPVFGTLTLVPVGASSSSAAKAVVAAQTTGDQSVTAVQDQAPFLLTTGLDQSGNPIPDPTQLPLVGPTPDTSALL